MALPPAAAEAAQQQYARRQVVALTVAAMAARQWAAVDEADIGASWLRRVPAVAAATSGAQWAAAASADPYVAAALQTTPAEWAVVAAALAAVAADGRPLPSLLYQPVITALTAIKAGRSPADGLLLGAHQLDTLIRTEVADAGRTADQVAATTHGAGGYVRLVVGATCSRCILLAGRVYPYSAGFERHPRCDCVMVPVADASEAELATSPQAVYDAMSPAERSAAGWSQAEQRAIADGADIFAVTNVHRGGLYVAGGKQFTREAAGRRPRITPRQIYLEAGDDRAEAIRLLKLHRYIR